MVFQLKLLNKLNIGFKKYVKNIYEGNALKCSLIFHNGRDLMQNVLNERKRLDAFPMHLIAQLFYSMMLSYSPWA